MWFDPFKAWSVHKVMLDGMVNDKIGIMESEIVSREPLLCVIMELDFVEDAALLVLHFLVGALED